MSNWWANKIGSQTTQQPAQQPQGYVQQQVVQPQPHVGHQALPGQQKLDNVSFTDALAMAQSGGIVSQGDPRGIKMHGETDHCPMCGSNNFFHRSSMSGRGGSAGGRVMNTNTGQLVSAAPLCMDCGFRGGVIPQQTGELYDAPQGD